MTTRVPFVPPAIVPASASDEIRAAMPVRGEDWNRIALALNSLMGRGGSLVVSGYCAPTPGTGSSSDSRYYFYTWPRSSNNSGMNDVRLWVVSGLHSLSSDIDMTVTLHDSSTSFTVRVTADDPNPTWEFVEETTTGEGETSIEFEISSSSDAVNIIQVCCYEVPRAFLDTAGGTNPGVRETTLTPGAPIFENTSQPHKYALQAVAFQEAAAATLCRRQAIFNWHDNTEVEITATSYPGGTGNVICDTIVCQARLVTNDTTATIKVAVRMKADTSQTASVRFTANSGDTVEITTTSTSFTWVTGEIDIETDEFGQPGLVRGGGTLPSLDIDHLTVEAKTTGGSMWITSISVGEG